MILLNEDDEVMLTEVAAQDEEQLQLRLNDLPHRGMTGRSSRGQCCIGMRCVGL
jgi:hypothetical protein